MFTAIGGANKYGSHSPAGSERSKAGKYAGFGRDGCALKRTYKVDETGPKCAEQSNQQQVRRPRWIAMRPGNLH